MSGWTKPTHNVSINPEEMKEMLFGEPSVLIEPDNRKIAFRVNLNIEDEEDLLGFAEALEESAENMRQEYDMATDD